MGVRDTYRDGRGNMLVKLGSIVTISESTGGPELGQGSLLRFLSEIIWFPSAALQDYIVWTPVDAHSATATISYGGVAASALFYFDDAGQPTNLMADRYRALDKGFSLDRWSTPASKYGQFNGIRIPTGGEAVWHLKRGDFHWLRLEILDVEYNIADTY
jgi:hypothetical protein